MKRKIVGIVVLMLVATTVVSATNIDVEESNNKIVNFEPYEPALFDWWSVDQKNTHQDGAGFQLIPTDTFAQSFTPTKDKLTAVSLYIFKYNTTPDPVQITVSIRDNLTGSDLVNKTIDTSVVTIKSKGTWVLFDFEDISITPGSKYFIVCSGNKNFTTGVYCWFFGYNDTYIKGEGWIKQGETSDWVTLNDFGYQEADMCFKTYFRKPLDISSVPQTVPSTPLAGMKMIDTSVTAVESLKNNAINATVPNISQASMGSVWAEEQKLLAVDGAAGDDFGIYASLDGDTALVGACADDDNGVDSGSAYVFTRTGTTWTQQAKLLPSDGAAGDLFGGAVSLSGDTALIGADQDSDNGNWSGSAYVFTRTGTVWTQQAKLLAPDGATEDLFGWWVSLDSNTALIAAKWDDDNGDKSGSAYVFTRTGTTWTLQQKLIGSDTAAGDRFGVDVCLDGDTAIIAACYDDDNGVECGSAYVFTRTGTTWAQQAKLLASDGAAGDSFGGDTGTTSIDGDTAIIGAWLDHDNGADSGSAYVFTRTGSTWTQQQKLLASDGAAGDSFGVATALDGDTAIIAACYDDDNGANSGSAYVFTRTGTTWTQLQKLLAPDGAAGDQFIICSLDGNTALMSAWQDDDNGANSGSAYVFTKTAGLTYSITGGLGVNLKITNTGTINVSGVPWLIHVEGGILGRINKTVNGTIDIPVGESKTVGTGMLFGFGAISITAKVADEEQTATGTQIIIFSMVKK
jgi:hypothetical protein